jgi:hypothetical protein
MQRPVPSFLLLFACGAIAACGTDNTGTSVANVAGVSQVSSSRNADDADDDEILSESDDDLDKPFTLAVIGDTPYGAAKLAEFPSLVTKINSDPAVRLVAHLGDVKAGKNSACTDEYLSGIRALFDNFADPLVYTPGDNEWTDCHVAIKNNGLYTPTERLAKVRSLFFPVAGRTLGVESMHVVTEARDPANAAYVENTLFRKSRVVFAALNITGSNNDLASWGTTLPASASDYPSQSQEFAARAQANKAWLAKTFATANRTHAAGVVLFFQADMWDTAEPTLAGFDALVQQIGTLAASFGKPVLMLEGDSHQFRVDNPFSASSSLHGLHSTTPIADNVTRIVVEGSDAGRTEYLRLSIDSRPKAASLFSWERVPLN